MTVDPTPPTFGSLFERLPERFSLRGDPHLWVELGKLYADTPMPESWFDVNRLVKSGFETVTGAALDLYEEYLSVEKFVTGTGMSDGSVSPKWWADIGEALIVDRWAAARPDKARASRGL